MRILLVGGAGFIGRNLVDTLLAAGNDVFVSDSISRLLSVDSFAGKISSQHVFKSGDFFSLLNNIDEFEIECVLFLASSLIPSSDSQGFQDEVISLTLPSFRFFEALARRAVKVLYFSSGGAVYGRHCKSLLVENDSLNPINHYGFSKVISEKYLDFLARTANLEYLIVRPSNPFGRFQDPSRKQGFVTVALDRLLNGLTIDVWGDGSAIRDYLWIDDLTSAISSLLLADGVWGKIFNVGSGVGHSINEILLFLEELTGRKADVRYLDGRSTDADRVILDISHLRSVVRYEPLSMRQALSTYISIYNDYS